MALVEPLRSMARINGEVLEKICKKMAVGERQAYEIISRRANELHLDRRLTALAVAAALGINISKASYATDEDRAILRSVTLGGAASRTAPSGASMVTTVAARTRRGTKKTKQSRKSNSVMVVYGRNQHVKSAIFSFLRSIGLEPIEWSHALRDTHSAAPFVGEVIETMFTKAAAVVVVLTPDDEARLKPEFVKQGDPAYEKKHTGQARPNVLFEAGRAFGSHPRSTVLVQIGEIRPFSDVAGRHIVRLNNSAASRRDFAARLETAGCEVDLAGSDWLEEGDFTLGQAAKQGRRRP